MRIFQKYILPAIEILFMLVFYLMFCSYDWTNSEFDWVVLKSPKTYVTAVLLSYICTYIYGFLQQRIVTYNKSYHPGSKAQSRLYRILQTNEIRCDIAYTMPEVIDEGVSQYNDYVYRKKCDKILHRVHGKIYYRDIDMAAVQEDYDAEVARLEKKFCIRSKQLKKRFQKIFQKVVTGNVKTDRVTSEQVMVAGFADDQRVNSLVNHATIIRVLKSAFHAVSTAFMFVATSVVFFQVIFEFNLEILITYAFYLLFAIVGGGTYGASMTNYYATLYRERNGFFAQYCGITAKWDGTTEEKSDFQKIQEKLKEEILRDERPISIYQEGQKAAQQERGDDEA